MGRRCVRTPRLPRCGAGFSGCCWVVSLLDERAGVRAGLRGSGVRGRWRAGRAARDGAAARAEDGRGCGGRVDARCRPCGRAPARYRAAGVAGQDEGGAGRRDVCGHWRVGRGEDRCDAAGDGGGAARACGGLAQEGSEGSEEQMEEGAGREERIQHHRASGPGVDRRRARPVRCGGCKSHVQNLFRNDDPSQGNPTYSSLKLRSAISFRHQRSCRPP